MTMRTGLAALAMIGASAATAAPAPTGSYVALGSSYAAGVGLGPMLADAPAVCGRTTLGYPQRVARDLRLRLVDASCGGATVEQIVDTGQSGLPPQIAAVRGNATLVTITAGGNDVDYVGDMIHTAATHDPDATLRSAGARPFALLRMRLQDMFAEIRSRAPHARIVIATYPSVLPRQGSCDALGLTPTQVATLRAVADRLAVVTRETARAAGAAVVDMAAASQDHDACSAAPWTNGAHPATGAAFHPNAAGAAATAQAVESLLAARSA
jgi:lysophospholipase L1-like esterase